MTTPKSDSRAKQQDTPFDLRPSINAWLRLAGDSPAEREALKHSFSYLVNRIDAAALIPVGECVDPDSQVHYVFLFKFLGDLENYIFLESL